MSNFNKAKKYHFIYKVTNLLNDTYYVGMHSTNKLNDGYMGSGKRLKYSIKKYGVENFKFEILEFFSSRDELKKRESELVNEDFINQPKCLNLKPGGQGGWINEEHQRKACLSANKRRLELLKNDPEFKKKYSEKCREVGIRLYKEGKIKHLNFDWTGKKHKPETIEKQRQVKIGTGLGETNSQFGTMWITNGSENKKIKKTDPVPQGWQLGRNLK